jgi:hypothetical protein
MSANYDIKFEEGIVFVTLAGEMDYKISSKMWADITGVCVENNCFHILGVQEGSTLSTVDAFKHTDLFQGLGINSKYCIAWAEQDSSVRQMLEYTASILKNNFLASGEIFKTKEEAIKWLKSQL